MKQDDGGPVKITRKDILKAIKLWTPAMGESDSDFKAGIRWGLSYCLRLKWKP